MLVRGATQCTPPPPPTPPPWNRHSECWLCNSLELAAGAVVGIDDEDDSTFTVTVDNKTFHFQVQLDIYQETGAGAGWSRGPFFAKASLLILLQPVLWIQVH